MAEKKKHPGFKEVQKDIAKKEGISEERAGAILASSSRKASPAAKKKNPNLKKVKWWQKVQHGNVKKVKTPRAD